MNITDSKARNRILIVLFAGVLMGALDIAIVGPALPAIQTAFGLDERSVAWIFTSYVLLDLVGTPLVAKLSDAFGRRPMYLLSISLFALGSLIVALSPSFGVALVGRAVQGLAAGGIFPVASAVIGDTFPPEKRGGALGLIGAVFGLAFLVGPILGGVLLLFGWRWLFVVNIPIAAALIIAALRVLPATRPRERKPFDWQGMAIMAVLLTALAYGINQIDTAHFGASIASLQVWPFLAVAIVAAPMFRLVEQRAQDPILRVGLFKSRQVRLVVTFALGAGLSEAAIVFAPQLLTASFGVSESTASFMLLPIVLTLAVGAPLAGRLLDRSGSRIVIMSGCTLLAAGMVLVSFFAWQLALFYLCAALIGVGLGMLLGAPLRYIMLGEAQATERASAQAALTLFTTTGQLLGGAIVGAVAESQGAGLPGYEHAYFAVGVIAAVLAVLAVGLKSRAEETATIQANSASSPAIGSRQPAGS